MEACAQFDSAPYASVFKRVGYFIQEGVFGDDVVAGLREAIAAIPAGEEVRKRRGVYGVRNLLDVCPAVVRLTGGDAARRFVEPILGRRAFAVRAIYFDKVPGANWSLFWHQDNVIAVAARHETPGFVGWSQKAGVWQVQPPAEVLARMVAVRIHLDDCGAENGPLRVLPGSHRHGWLDDELDRWKAHVPEVVCTVGQGGVVVMCPLVLHASAPAAAPGHRRVIHIEYAADELPGELDWHTRVGASA